MILGNRLTYGLAESQTLPLSCDNDDHLSAIQNRGNTDCKSHSGNRSDIVIEEPSISEDRIISQSLDSGPGREGGARLVKGNVPVLSNATKEQVDPTIFFDLLFVSVL
jgi:hypothetical protein